jgi:hypothetical protein
MSVIQRDGTRIIPARSGLNPFWEEVQEYLDREPDRMWRYLAMLALHELGGWPLERIGRAFGHSRGHVSRCLDRVRDDLRERFGPHGDRHCPEDRDPPRNIYERREAQGHNQSSTDR